MKAYFVCKIYEIVDVLSICIKEATFPMFYLGPFLEHA